MKSTNVVKHSNIVDREKRSEALGTGNNVGNRLLCSGNKMGEHKIGSRSSRLCNCHSSLDSDGSHMAHS